MEQDYDSDAADISSDYYLYVLLSNEAEKLGFKELSDFFSSKAKDLSP